MDVKSQASSHNNSVVDAKSSGTANFAADIRSQGSRQSPKSNYSKLGSNVPSLSNTFVQQDSGMANSQQNVKLLQFEHSMTSDSEKFGKMLIAAAMSPKNMQRSPTNKSMISNNSFIIASKVDNHLKQGNLNYVMRRSTLIAMGGQNNGNIDGAQKNNFRNATQVQLSAKGGSLYKKAASFQLGPDGQPRRPSMAQMGSLGKFHDSMLSHTLGGTHGNTPVNTQSTTKQIFQAPVLGQTNSRIQDQTPESSFKTNANRDQMNNYSPLTGSILPGQEKQEFSQTIEMSSSEELLQSIKDNDLRLFRLKLFNLSNADIVKLRFMEEDLNILQTICFFNAEQLIEPLKERFKDDIDHCFQLVDYAEPSAGNKAIHFAVLSGNNKIIDFVLQDLKADAKILTASGLSVLHCAAQIDRGALSLMLFTQRKYGLYVNHKDNFDCTPLHWAVTNGQFKCVECLLALGANPNALNTEGATPLHIAVQKYIHMNTERNIRHMNPPAEDDNEALEQDQYQDEEDEFLYEDLKRIMKELLFQGARREIRAKFDLSNTDTEMNVDDAKSFNRISTVSKTVSPYEMLMHFQKELPEKEFNSLRIILMDQNYNQCMMMHRPLKKVQKDPQLLVTTVILNILIFILQILFQIHYAKSDPEGYDLSMFKKWSIATNILFPATAFFYFLAAFLKPGFVIPEFDILELLRIANDKQIDLDNFCFYCRVIKSGRTVHCNFCNRCVEKFDHHCNFVNNCLGYRNHKYFLAFIFLYLGYFTTSSVASVMSFFTHIENDSFSQQMDYVFRILSLIFNCTQLIPLFYQIKEQTKKLMKRTTRFKGVRRMRGKSLYENAGSSGDSSEGGDSIQKKASVKRSGTAFQSFTDVVETRAGFCYNLGQILNYKHPTQEELRAFLFSESERFSTFVIKYHKRKDLNLDKTASALEPSPSQPLLASQSDIRDSSPQYQASHLSHNNINRSMIPGDSVFKSTSLISA